MELAEFEKLVYEGVQLIPQKFRDRLDNVAIFTARYPTYEQQQKVNLRPGWTLFGLYEGVPIPKRGSNYAMVLPDRITIFQEPIVLAAAGDPEKVRSIVKNTVWHEIAHHFGMNEKEVREAERRRGVTH